MSPQTATVHAACHSVQLPCKRESCLKEWRVPSCRSDTKTFFPALCRAGRSPTVLLSAAALVKCSHFPESRAQCIHIHICIYKRTCIYIYTYMYVNLHIFLFVYVYVYIYTHICIHLMAYIHTSHIFPTVLSKLKRHRLRRLRARSFQAD